MMSDPHIGFVIAAYAVAAAVIAVMIGAVVFDYRRLSAISKRPRARSRPPATAGQGSRLDERDH